MDVSVSKSILSGKAGAPPSKSFTHRAIILASLAEGVSAISNILLSDDTTLTIDACRKLGAKIELVGDRAIIEGFAGVPKPDPGTAIYLGNSGTSMRLLASIAALSKTPVILDGDRRMRERPIRDLLDALNSAGANARTLDRSDCPPIEVSSENGYSGGEIEVSGKISSQFLSSLLLVSPFASKKTVIRVKGGLKSKPYVAITMELMRLFGATVDNDDYSRFDVLPIGSYKPRKYKVEGDFSSASYFFAAAAVTGSTVAVTGLNPNSVQGDAKFLGILSSMGAVVSRQEDGRITVRGPPQLRGAGAIDCSDCPDAVQTICAAAACADGTTRITNIGHLRHKESDRISDTVEELSKFGVEAKAGEDFIEIFGRGTSQLKGAKVNCHKDHRMAMAFAVLGLAVGDTIIEGAECVSKSFPDFFDEIEKLGAKIGRKG